MMPVWYRGRATLRGWSPSSALVASAVAAWFASSLLMLLLLQSDCAIRCSAVTLEVAWELRCGGDGDGGDSVYDRAGDGVLIVADDTELKCRGV